MMNQKLWRSTMHPEYFGIKKRTSYAWSPTLALVSERARLRGRFTDSGIWCTIKSPRWQALWFLIFACAACGTISHMGWF
jgi:hypothetical protein